MRQRPGLFLVNSSFKSHYPRENAIEQRHSVFLAISSSSKRTVYMPFRCFSSRQWCIYEDNSKDQKVSGLLCAKIPQIALLKSYSSFRPFLSFFMALHSTSKRVLRAIILHTEGRSAWSNIICSRGDERFETEWKEDTCRYFIPMVRKRYNLHHHAGTKVHSLIPSAQGSAPISRILLVRELHFSIIFNAIRPS